MATARKAAWAALMLIHSLLASAAAPVCCKLFEFDASSLLGDDPAVCGTIVDGDAPAEAQAESVEERKLATRCALEAQQQGRAFVYTYRLVVPPDIDMITQAVFGAHGERLLMKLGRYGGESIRTVAVCSTLVVMVDGKPKGSGCYLTRP